MPSRNEYDALSTETDQLNESSDANSESDKSKESKLVPLTPRQEVEFNGNERQEEEVDYVEVVILDSAQNRFPVDVHPGWTVKRLKEVSQHVHKVHPLAQRLIFRGRMLEDDVALQDAGIVENGVIIHLFPKPRLVVTSSGADESNTREKSMLVGAHIPQIVLDEEEQERRGQILVLGSVEIAEAQNNCKLLSLLLLVVCSMRLLVLLSIALGAPTEGPHSDGAGQGNSTAHPDENYQPESRPWENYDYCDLLVSALGFYVATLGMKATTENTLRLATAYFVGTTAVGVLWNVWNIFVYAMFVKEKSSPEDDDEEPLTRDDYVTVALFTVALPMLIWGLCVARAYEFRKLIEEAEIEAIGRIHRYTQSDEETELRENVEDRSTVV